MNTSIANVELRMSNAGRCAWYFIRNSQFAIRNWLLLAAALLLAACETTRANPDGENPEEKPDQEIITGELQSDFLELGPQAGVQWLSFYPDDFLEYPELFEGLDQDQRKRTRLAPREGANKVLLKFDLPAGAKIKPVDWYGTECVAIDLPDAKGFTVALATAPPGTTYETYSDADVKPLADARAKRIGATAKVEQSSVAGFDVKLDGSTLAFYSMMGVFSVAREPATRMFAYLEAVNLSPKGELMPLTPSVQKAAHTILKGMSIVRDLALEGSPKHQCKSTIDDLKAGIVAYENGGLKLALPEGWELRKSGGSSTVEIHGGGAKPLALIRKLKPTGTFSRSNLRMLVASDTVFSRRKARPDGFFGAGRALTDKEPYVIAFDYKDKSQEQVALCVIATGNELLTVEIIGTGVIEGEARRKLRDACLEMLKSAKPSATVANRVKDLDELVGWKPQ